MDNHPTWATTLPLLQKNLDTPSMIFQKSQPPIINESSHDEYYIWSLETVLMVRWRRDRCGFDQPYKQTESKMQVTWKI